MENNQDLQAQIDELKRRLDERDKQQISFPLDVQSVLILNKYFMRITDTVSVEAGVSGHVFTSYIGNQDQLQFEVSQNTFIKYTVDPTADTITVSRGYFNNGDHLYVSTDGTPPSPLTITGDYYVVSVDSTGQIFKLSLTFGGAPIDITDAGTGNQYIYFF